MRNKKERDDGRKLERKGDGKLVRKRWAKKRKGSTIS